MISLALPIGAAAIAAFLLWKAGGDDDAAPDGDGEATPEGDGADDGSGAAAGNGDAYSGGYDSGQASNGGGGGGGGGGGAPYGQPNATSATNAASAAKTAGLNISAAKFKPKKTFKPTGIAPPGADPSAFKPTFAAKPAAFMPAFKPTATVLPMPKPTQPVNASQTSVLNAQKTLQKLGFAFGALDGLYGPKTAAAWANAVAKYPPPNGPDYDRRANFARVDGKTALVYRPSAERLAAQALGKPAPASSAVPSSVSKVVAASKPAAAAPKPAYSPFVATPAPSPTSFVKPNFTPAPSKSAFTVAPVSSKPKPPAGFNASEARRLAPSLASHLKSKGKAGYSKSTLQSWQKVAGIAQDGLYGRGSAAALKHYTSSAPAAFYAQGTDSYPWK